MTLPIIRINPDEIIVNMSDVSLTWQDWHQLVMHIAKISQQIQQPIKLILLTNPETDMSSIIAETTDYLMSPSIFKEIYIAGPSQYMDVIEPMLLYLNSECDVKWYYRSSDNLMSNTSI